jgi:hypothetical protein
MKDIFLGGGTIGGIELLDKMPIDQESIKLLLQVVLAVVTLGKMFFDHRAKKKSRKSPDKK